LVKTFLYNRPDNSGFVLVKNLIHLYNINEVFIVIKVQPREIDYGEEMAVDALRRHGGVAHTGELMREGVRPAALMALWRQGRVLRLKAGLYQLPEAMADEYAAVVQAVLAVPRGVICLLSALDMHGLTDANPERVFVALPQGSWVPRVAEPPLQIVQYSKRLFPLGRMETLIGNHPISLYSPEKTLCDCFRLPELVGLDLSLLALRRYLRRPEANVSALLTLAEQCRVARRLRPYVEALIA
jgi:predicted transcriptional regulator of viral defense system